jgi:hypothetical protein
MNRLTADQHTRYRQARARNLPAAAAWHHARHPCTPPGWDYTLDGDSVRFIPTTGCTEFALTASAIPDTDPDVSWLGQFSNQWAAGAIIDNPTGSARGRYFHPAIAYAVRHRYLRACGYGRHAAHTQAMADLRVDRDTARDPDVVVIEVTASRAEITLGTAHLGGVVIHGPDRAALMVEIITAHRLLDDAIDTARHALLSLAA